MSTRDRVIDQVASAVLTWHERSSRRLDSAAIEDDDSDTESETFDLSITVKVRRPEADEGLPHVRIRERMEITHDHLATALDAEVVFQMQSDFDLKDGQAIETFVNDVGGEFVLGFLRTAYADDGRAMGIHPPLVPAIAFDYEQPQLSDS